MKILIVSKNWLGDVLFQFPALEAIRERFPRAQIVCIAPRRCREILESHPAVDKVLIFDEKHEHRSIFSRLNFAVKLREEKWDQAYLFHRSRTRAFLVWLAGAKERYGFGRGRSWFLTKSVKEPAAPMHRVDYFLYFLRRLGFDRITTAQYRFHYSDQAKHSCEVLLGKQSLGDKSFVCFHLGANWEPKCWPVSHFATLADLIYERWQCPVVVTGATNDLPLVHDLQREAKKARIISLVAQTSLEELGAVFGRSLCLVTGDSGPMHLAAGVGTSLIALFGPTNPQWTGPRGIGDQEIITYVPPGYRVPWYGKQLPKDGWLSHISPQQVFAVLENKKWIPEINSDDGNKSLSSIEAAQVKNPYDEVRKVLVVTLSNIGDVILTTPVITSVAERFPNASVTVVAGPRAKCLLENSRFIQRLVIYDKGAHVLDQWKFICQLREDSYDWVIDIRNTLIPFLVSTKKRSPVFRKFRSVSMRARHLDVLRMMRLDVRDAPAFDFFDQENEQNALDKIKEEGVFADRDWILVAPAARSELKTWRLAGFREVIDRLLGEQAEDILLVGDNRERNIAEPLVEIHPKRIHNLAGRISLKETAALIARASLLLTNDSALMHLGFELNRPVVALFGPTSHEKYGHQGPRFRIVREPVFCSPCEKPICRFDRQACFEDLKSDTVFDTCKEFLNVQQSAVKSTL